MTRQRAQKEWAIKAKVERETAVKCTQCYLMCAQFATLSLPCFSAWLNCRPTVQPGLYLGLSHALWYHAIHYLIVCA